MIKKISNLGDSALYCDFGDEVNQLINSRVIKVFKNLRKNMIKGVINITPSYNKLIIPKSNETISLLYEGVILVIPLILFFLKYLKNPITSEFIL